MKIASLVFTALVLVAGSATADDFIIGAYLDPYSAHTNASSAIIQEYFDSLKSFGLNRVMGIGDAVTTGQGIANTFGRFMVIPRNTIGGVATEVEVR